MDARNHFKNGASQKSQTNRGNLRTTQMFTFGKFLMMTAIVAICGCADEKNSENKINEFKINSEFGIINHTDKTITVELPMGTNVTALTPFVSVSEKADYLPKGMQNFTEPVAYTVTAEDGSSAVYSVTVKLINLEIRSFTFTGLESTVKVTINKTDIKITVPFYTDVTKLTPIIELPEGTTVSPQSGVQTDFTNPVKYNFTSNNLTITYTVSVNITKMQIKSVDKTTVAILDTLRIKGNFAPSGNTVHFGSVFSTPPIQNDSIITVVIWDGFASPSLGENKLTVTNNWGSVDYSEPITITAPLRKINSFNMNLRIGNVTYFIDATIDESAKIITAMLPFGVDITNVSPDISISQGAKISPESGVATDFTNPVNYVVTAKDGSKTTYVAIIMAAPRIIISNVDKTVLEVGDEITITGTFAAFGNNVILSDELTDYTLTMVSESATKLVCKSQGYMTPGNYQLCVRSSSDPTNEDIYTQSVTLTETTKLPQIVSLNKTEFKVGESIEITGVRFPNETAQLSFNGPSSFILIGFIPVNNKIVVTVPSSYKLGKYTISLYFIESKLYTNRMTIEIVE